MKNIVNVQILRGVAALMIVIYHCGIEACAIAQTRGGGDLFNYHPFGQGVPLFFAISGFIMLVTSDGAFGQSGAAADFVRRRLVRIVPLYWIATSLALAANALAPHLTKGSLDGPYVIGSYLFWPLARPTGEFRPLASPGWTLNLEMFFYAIFALGLLMPRRLGLPFVVALLGGLCALRVGGFFGDSGALHFWGDPIIVGFLGGIAVAWLYLKGWRLPAGVAAAIALVGFAGFWLPVPEGLPEDALAARLAAALPAMLVLAGATLGPRLPNWRLCLGAAFVGEMSYSLYLFHEFLLRPLRGAWSASIPASVSLWAFVILGTGLSLILGFLAWRFLEKPSSAALGHYWSGEPRRDEIRAGQTGVKGGPRLQPILLRRRLQVQDPRFRQRLAALSLSRGGKESSRTSRPRLAPRPSGATRAKSEKPARSHPS